MKSGLIFTNRFEDFAKIFLATFLVFVLMMMTDQMVASTAFLLITIYFLDGGHVYSTLLEVLADPEEVRKKYVWIVLLGSFLLNFVIHLVFTGYFFYYLFYFTIYHNMRQGLGITFLYRVGEKRSASIIKCAYYFLTMVPLILFHMRPPFLQGKLEEALFKPIELYQFFSAQSLETVFKVGVLIYILGAIVILTYLIFQKNHRGFLSMLFFSTIYAYAFLISGNELKSYGLLIFSHVVPYYFLMEKRLGITHKLNLMQKYAWFFLLIVFAIGGVLEYHQRDIVTMMEPMESIGLALLTTPLISHFIFDAIIWKRGNERFKAFIDSSRP